MMKESQLKKKTKVIMIIQLIVFFFDLCLAIIVFSLFITNILLGLL